MIHATESIKARWQDNRKIVKRLVITGQLILLTPARFGGGESRTAEQEATDMPLARDPKDRIPLLTGASLAGAARAYLREWHNGYEQNLPEDADSLSQALFGEVLEHVPEDERESRESWLIVDDAYATAYGTETRPGVAIDSKTRMAKPGALYDIELLEAGTKFDLRWELALPTELEIQTRLRQALAVALTGFERGEIGLGARKRRGLGECKVTNWNVQEYDLLTGTGLGAWLEGKPGTQNAGKTIAEKLDVSLSAVPDKRRRFTLKASFRLDSSLLIRSASIEPNAPDMTHLKSRRGGVDRPILSGTALAGAMRSRALRIARVLIPNEPRARQLVEDTFGPEKIERGEGVPKWASRLTVREREVMNEYERVISRVKIDRFTGGAYPGALFDQQPVMGQQNAPAHLTLEFDLRQPKEEQIGLLLHLLKDLWTGDLPLGGEASVGRGRLQGVKAELALQDPDLEKPESWCITALDESKLDITGKRDLLEKFAGQKEVSNEP